MAKQLLDRATLAVERAAQPLLPLQGPKRGLKTPPLEPLFVALEGSKGIEV